MAHDRERFDQRLLELVTRVTVCGAAVRWDDIVVEPVPVITVGEHAGVLDVRLAFQYGTQRLPFDASYPSQAILHGSEELHLIRIMRDSEAERAVVVMLEHHALRWVEADIYRTRRAMAPTDFMLRVVGALASQGVQVSGEADLTAVQMRVNEPQISVTVQSHIDWFDVAAVR
jgi:hypothetical protein